MRSLLLAADAPLTFRRAPSMRCAPLVAAQWTLSRRAVDQAQEDGWGAQARMGHDWGEGIEGLHEIRCAAMASWWPCRPFQTH